MFGEPKEDIFYTLFKEFGAKIVRSIQPFSMGIPRRGLVSHR